MRIPAKQAISTRQNNRRRTASFRTEQLRARLSAASPKRDKKETAQILPPTKNRRQTRSSPRTPRSEPCPSVLGRSTVGTCPGEPARKTQGQDCALREHVRRNHTRNGRTGIFRAVSSSRMPCRRIQWMQSKRKTLPQGTGAKTAKNSRENHHLSTGCENKHLQEEDAKRNC